MYRVHASGGVRLSVFAFQPPYDTNGFAHVGASVWGLVRRQRGRPRDLSVGSPKGKSSTQDPCRAEGGC